MKKRAKLIISLLTLLQLNFCLLNQSKSNDSFTIESVAKKKAKSYVLSGPDEYESNHSAMQSSDSLYFTRNEDGRLIDIKEKNSISTYAVKDQYENNNSFSQATVALDATYFNKKGFSNIYTVLGGTIHSKDDVDYYSYDIWGEGTFKVRLNDIPTGCDYDIELYRMGNNLSTKCESSEIITSSKHSSNLNETIEVSVIPGTYYVKVLSYKGYDEKNSYQLIFDYKESEGEGKGKFSIKESKARGEMAAVWKSDFMPCSQNIVGKEVEDAYIKYSNYGNYPLITHLTDAYYSDQDMDYICLYIWDNNLKKLR